MNKKTTGMMALAFLLGAFCLPACRKAQDPGDKIVVGETIALPSKHLGRTMIVDVYLPDGYGRASRRYPVFLTCQSSGRHASGIAENAARKSLAPELIVASVRNYLADEFIPEKIEGHPGSAGADRFIAFFGDELIPDLDSRYRTRPFRLFYSGSYGGAFCVYALLTRPEVFNAYLAATPAIDYEGGSGLIPARARSWLEARAYEDRFLYMGVENDPRLVAVLERFVDDLKIAAPKGLKWEYHPFLDEDHASLPNRVIYHGLKFAFSDWNTVPEEVVRRGVPAIRARAAGLRKEYGYDIGPSPFAVWQGAAFYRKAKRTADVIELLRFGLEYEPDSEMTWLNLGRAYEEAGRLDQAKAALETARRLAVEKASPNLGVVAASLDRVKRKLSGE